MLKRHFECSETVAHPAASWVAGLEVEDESELEIQNSALEIEINIQMCIKIMAERIYNNRSSVVLVLIMFTRKIHANHLP